MQEPFPELTDLELCSCSMWISEDLDPAHTAKSAPLRLPLCSPTISFSSNATDALSSDIGHAQLATMVVPANLNSVIEFYSTGEILLEIM